MNAHPHELAALLLALGRAGIELAPHPNDPTRLRHRPADLPPDLSARLRIHRATVVGLLVNGYAPAGDEAEYVLGERLGIADGLGMPTHPGSAAWLVAVGRALGANDPIARVDAKAAVARAPPTPQHTPSRNGHPPTTQDAKGIEAGHLVALMAEAKQWNDAARKKSRLQSRVLALIEVCGRLGLWQP